MILPFVVKDLEDGRTRLKDFQRASDDTSCFSGEMASEIKEQIVQEEALSQRSRKGN